MQTGENSEKQMGGTFKPNQLAQKILLQKSYIQRMILKDVDQPFITDAEYLEMILKMLVSETITMKRLILHVNSTSTLVVFS